MKYKVYIREKKTSIVLIEAEDMAAARAQAIADYMREKKADNDPNSIVDWEVKADVMID